MTHVKDKTECAHGHSYADPSNVYVNTKGHRVCRTCRKFHDSRRKRPTVQPGTLGAEIRAWRTARGVSRSELARRVGVAATTLERIELGRSKRLKPSTMQAWLCVREQETDIERHRAITAKARRDSLPRAYGNRAYRIGVSVNVEQALLLAELFVTMRRGGDPRVLLSSSVGVRLAHVVAKAASRAEGLCELGAKQKKERAA